MRISHKLLILFTCVCVLTACHKEPLHSLPRSKAFGLANIFGSDMVIQRDKPCLLWGNAPAGNTVSVKVSWNSSPFSATADSTGAWQVTIPAAGVNASPQTISCSIPNFAPIALNNILIGDVWLCSGQSNMAMPMTAKSTVFIGVLNYNSEIAAADYPQIRVATIMPDSTLSPLNSFSSAPGWKVCGPATAGNISAVAYYFARKLNTKLNIPIGIIVSAASGTNCKVWTSRQTVLNDTLLNNYYNDNTVGTMYNAMIYPLKDLSVKGFIWYQGEANKDDVPPSNYTVLNSALIANWRSLFNQGVLPFYFVQVAPFTLNNNPVADDYAKFREAQANIRAVAGTGMAVTMDVGEPNNLHPINKRPVGERLALLALNYTYGQIVQCVGPQYASYTVSNDVATVNFTAGTAGGLNTINNDPLAPYFFVAGTDHKFRQGTAVISGNQVLVTAPAGTPLPIQAVRYAFTDFPVTNLQNSAGLPAEPFRTDNWSN